MKKISALLLLILASAFLCKGQERLEQALERYDYRRALEIIDSLAAEIGTDSTAMAGNREEVIDLAIQKSLCLRKLYRAEEAAEALADVLHLDQFNMELLGNLAESHMQAGNTMDAFRIYGILGQMQADNPYFNICQARILYREKKYGDCLSTCRTIIARDSIPEIISMAGDAYKNLGQADSALACYNQVLRMKPEHVATMSKKADVLLGMKQYPPVIEMSHEALNSLTLYVAEIGESILNGLIIRHIGKQLLRGGKILVDIIEVTQYHIAPEDEFIQTLRFRIQFLIAVIQFDKQGHLIGDMQTAYPVEQIVDSQHQRSFHRPCTSFQCRFSNPGTQPLTKENHRTSVWKDKASAADVSPVNIMVCDLFQKRRHHI